MEMTEQTPLPDLPRLAARIYGTPLLIDPAKLEAIMGVIGPRMEGLKLAASSGIAAGKRPYAVAAGVAIIPVLGTLVHRHDWVAAESGLTSYERLSAMLTMAQDDPAVEAVLLDIDSPGGEAAGAADLADQIYALRQEKPVYALANDMAASAAYKIASAAEKIYVTRSALVGSIGVIMAHRDQSGFNEKAGIRYTMIYAGARKKDLNPHEPPSDEALASAQQIVDGFYEIFTATVARNRGMSQQAVKDTEAAVFMGAEAVNVGLADAVGNFSDAFKALAMRIQNPASPTTLSSTTTMELSMSDTQHTVPEPQADAPAAPAQAALPAIDANKLAEDERARAASILKAASKLNVPADIAETLIKGNLSLDAAKAKLADYVAEHSPVKDVSAVNSSASPVEALPDDERAEAAWNRDPKLREEFLTKEDYCAYKRNEHLIRVFRK